MPSGTVKRYAEKSGKSVQEVEAIWDSVKATARKKFKDEDSHFWAYVSAVTKKKCGITESFSFKDTVV